MVNKETREPEATITALRAEYARGRSEGYADGRAETYAQAAAYLLEQGPFAPSIHFKIPFFVRLNMAWHLMRRPQVIFGYACVLAGRHYTAQVEGHNHG